MFIKLLILRTGTALYNFNTAMPCFVSWSDGVDDSAHIIGHAMFLQEFFAGLAHCSSVERISTTHGLVDFPMQTLALHVAIVLVFAVSTTQKHIRKLGHTALCTHCASLVPIDCCTRLS